MSQQKRLLSVINKQQKLGRANVLYCICKILRLNTLGKTFL